MIFSFRLGLASRDSPSHRKKTSLNASGCREEAPFLEETNVKPEPRDSEAELLDVQHIDI